MKFFTSVFYPTIFLTCLLLFYSCKQHGDSMFTALKADKTGLDFVNRLDPDPAFNLFSYMYYYNGAGVGAGDVNNDGLTDLFFAANRTGSRLYLNRGSLKFEDITLSAGIPVDSLWSTGVSVVDLNQDGLLDIYVCRVGNYKVLKGKNSLYINKGNDASGIPRFSDEAEKYGLGFAGYSTQAAFLDYDGDEDLDMFLLNHSVNHEGNYKPRAIFDGTFDSLSGHRLFRNDSEYGAAGIIQPRFTDVSRLCGISTSKIGYGLGVSVSDIDLDGWPDIYVGNDFHENDYLYINQRNGTFRDEGTERLCHTSQFSMGVDIADVTNDAHPEIISMDMLPYDPYMLRRSLSEDDNTIFRQKIEYGYSYQYARNNLQLNRGNGRFTEIGQYAGVFATDWSWAALWMDFNNDGNKDLFVSNGIPKRMNDIDYINYVSGEEVQRKLSENSLESKDLALLKKFPEIKIPNQFFLNDGKAKFTNYTDSIANNPVSFSNGAVYADLDNDGDLDVVVSNINDPALIYRNNTNQNKADRSFAQLVLHGSRKNRNAIGSKLYVFSGDRTYSYESIAVHGFLSSMQSALHVGLHQLTPDSAWLIWPDQTYQRVVLAPGKRDTLSYQTGLTKWTPALLASRLQPEGMSFEDLTAVAGLTYRHQENRFDEFDREPLIPHMLTTEGPALAVGDINHDGLEDVFIGSSKTFHPAVFLQTTSGRFVRMKQPALDLDSMWEHVDAVWQDVNSDTHADLVIATGGNEYYGNDQHLKPLLYMNDGRGNLTKKEEAFDAVFVTQSKVLAHDINGDGNVDLFFAGRSEPWQFGKPARSFLLLNDGKGKFRDVTSLWSKELMIPGLVTDASWDDVNGDGRSDLVLSYQWGGIDAFIYVDGHFKRQSLTDIKGWWQFFKLVDLDLDGDKDIVAGNLGLNSRLRASKTQPVRLYVNDFDGNGIIEQIMTYYVGGREIPFASKVSMEKSLPILKKNFLYAADFARTDLRQLLGDEKLEKSQVLEANCFENMIFLNQGKMNFEAIPWPAAAQWTSYKSLVVLDANGDKLPDLLPGGNFYANNVEIGRMDGDPGTLLINMGKGRFKTSAVNGLHMVGEIRRIVSIQMPTGHHLILARNNDSLLLIRQK